MDIRPFRAQDFHLWEPVWIANNFGEIGNAVTKQTWSRIIDPDSPVGGLGLFTRGEDKLVGILHYVLHPTTGSLKDACYMQDLFIRPEHRGRGLALRLIEDLARRGEKAGWSRLYWLAEAQNEAAQALYKKVGVKLNFTLHLYPLGQ